MNPIYSYSSKIFNNTKIELFTDKLEHSSGFAYMNKSQTILVKEIVEIKVSSVTPKVILGLTGGQTFEISLPSNTEKDKLYKALQETVKSK